jgi:Fe2+ or Zn2+ uptake regulation protein
MTAILEEKRNIEDALGTTFSDAEWGKLQNLPTRSIELITETLSLINSEREPGNRFNVSLAAAQSINQSFSLHDYSFPSSAVGISSSYINQQQIGKLVAGRPGFFFTEHSTSADGEWVTNNIDEIVTSMKKGTEIVFYNEAICPPRFPDTAEDLKARLHLQLDRRTASFWVGFLRGDVKNPIFQTVKDIYEFTKSQIGGIDAAIPELLKILTAEHVNTGQPNGVFDCLEYEMAVNLGLKKHLLNGVKITYKTEAAPFEAYIHHIASTEYERITTDLLVAGDLPHALSTVYNALRRLAARNIIRDIALLNDIASSTQEAPKSIHIIPFGIGHAPHICELAALSGLQMERVNRRHKDFAGEVTNLEIVRREIKNVEQEMSFNSNSYPAHLHETLVNELFHYISGRIALITDNGQFTGDKVNNELAQKNFSIVEKEQILCALTREEHESVVYLVSESQRLIKELLLKKGLI